MRKGIVVATAAATAAALMGGLGAAAPAQADPGSKGYVTQREFRKVTKGMSIVKAHRIFGTKGRPTAYIDYIRVPGDTKGLRPRIYKTPEKTGSVMVTYHKVAGVWKVKSKEAFWR